MRMKVKFKVVPALSVGCMTHVSQNHGASWEMHLGNLEVDRMMKVFYQPGRQNRSGWKEKFDP